MDRLTCPHPSYYLIFSLRLYYREIRSVEDVSSGYSSTEFLPTDTVSGTIEAVIRRAGSVRSSSRSRPVTMVDTHTKTTRSGRGSGSDVSNRCSMGSRLIKMIDFFEDGGSRRQKRQAEGCH